MDDVDYDDHGVDVVDDSGLVICGLMTLLLNDDCILAGRPARTGCDFWAANDDFVWKRNFMKGALHIGAWMSRDVTNDV